jgi:hypothetical protein
LLSLPIPGGPGSQEWLGDTGRIHKLDEPVEGAGKTTPKMISGEKQATGKESYVEIKAPTTVGTRSSVPYTQVLPSYRKKAESALNDQRIPKQHEKRVKEYFDSLAGGKGK